MVKKILITADRIGDVGMEILEGRGFEVINSKEQATEEELCEAAERYQVDVIIVRRAKVGSRLMDASSNLRGIVKTGVGLDAIDVDAATERKLILCNGAGVNTQAVAELAFSLVLSLVRNIGPADNGTKLGEWPRATYQVRGLQGSVFGIIGLGNIGRRVAEMARPFGAQLCAYSPNAPKDAFEPDIEKIDNLEEILKISDVISLHTPARPDNYRLYNAKMFSLMKPTAFFVNTGRGSLVDESALTQALVDGTIGGAGLDVFDPEPIEPDNPLLKAPNLVVTPHVSSKTFGVIDRTAERAAQSACQIIDNERPDAAYLVNPEIFK
ncbi:hydroxyacid dehydrogenase [Alphaproteobacteria bacterium]|jgi:D-3-phosphoglycerate dehydrogenase|nr:hydroxyacid dehydrogenase [Alphaproteobacteria bacterium]